MAYNAKKVKLKRLFVEAYTLYTADMQRRVTRTDDDERPRKLAKRSEETLDCRLTRDRKSVSLQ